MTGPNRLTRHGKKGRRKRLHSANEHSERSLGGIPMKISNGKISYADKHATHRPWNWKGSEENERDNAILPEGEGDFVRRHIYEMRFDIWDETDKERRKKEYIEWYEEQNI